MIEAKHTPVSAKSDKTREAFEAWFGGVLDLTTKPDAWRGPVYVHEHVESIWYGWQACSASHAQEVKRLRDELSNIANADPSKWEPDVRDQFREWAQNRARAALQGDK